MTLLKDNSYNLFLDDQRSPDHDPIYERVDGQTRVVYLPLMDWVVVRNYEDFVQVITERGLPRIISYDHDLSTEHYLEGFQGLPPRYDEYQEKTGYHCLQWLVQYCEERNLDLPVSYVHSMNPVGRDNLFSLIESYRKYRKNQLCS